MKQFLCLFFLLVCVHLAKGQTTYSATPSLGTWTSCTAPSQTCPNLITYDGSTFKLRVISIVGNTITVELKRCDGSKLGNLGGLINFRDDVCNPVTGNYNPSAIAIFFTDYSKQFSFNVSHTSGTIDVMAAIEVNTANPAIHQYYYTESITIEAQNCRSSDSLALVDLYNATGGVNWTNTWDLNQSMDTWYGVTLNASGCVETLTLSSNNLVGNLIDLNLPSLIDLSLSSNQLSNNIPNFSHLPNLIKLYLNNNQFIGNLPNFSNLPDLLYLNLGNNGLTGNIPDFNNLSNLSQLALYDNNLSGTIPDFSNLSNVTILSLHTNGLTGTIPNFSNCTNIQHINLEGNQLNGTIPDFILPNLMFLTLNDNNLGGDFPTLLGCPKITSLNFYDNRINSCPIFSGMNNLQALRNYNNLLTFNHIVGNVDVVNSILEYFPQDSVGVIQTITLSINDSYTINLGFDDTVTTSTYNWYKDGIFIGATTTNQFPITNAQPTHAGQYDVQVTNSVATGLTLYTQPITIQVQSSCRSSDSLALVDLYNATGGVNWTYTTATYWDGNNNRNIPNKGIAWNFNQPIDTWHGVQLNSNGCVELLSLPNNNLVGNLIDINLPSLEELYLYVNQLSGNLFDFSNLSNLTTLRLDYNILTGNIFDFSNLSNVTSLSLQKNQLTGNIPNFTNLNNLKSLNLSDNQLSGNIPDFTNLSNLEELYLHDNQLNGNIPNFTTLPNLIHLRFYKNQLSGNIPDFTNLSNLEGLHLYDNQLSGNIPNFINLPNLKELRLENNQLTGNIPDFTNLSNLLHLSLHSNQLTGNIPNFTNLSNLTYLYLNSNQLNGTIPNFTNLPNLIWLNLNSNQLTGSTPDFTNLPNLIHLYLNLNQLTGSIPNFTNLPNLTNFYIDNNQLTGSIPNFTNLPNLTHLYVYDNQLTGNIPNFNNSPNLIWLLLYKNQFNSCSEFLNLNNLQFFRLYDNNLTFDDIIPNIGKASINYSYTPQDSVGTIQTISLNTNDNYTINLGFDNSITTSTYNWYKDGIFIGSTTTNQFPITNAQPADAGQYDVQVTNSVATGLTLYTRPITIQVQSSCRSSDSLALVDLYNATGGVNWTNTWDLNQSMDTWYGVTLNASGCVETLTLSSNNLVGNLIDLNLPSLTSLTLPNNQLSGNIPNFSNLNSLTYLYLTINQLSGSVPDFSNLSNLGILVLSNNQLSGSIPNFSSLPNLTDLQLSNNQLTGNIPNFSNIPNITRLMLSLNQLSGNIPNFNNLPNLNTFHASNNQLDGTIPTFNNLSNLLALFLDNNQLSGTIPTFNNLSNLSQLVLYQNQLSGNIPNFNTFPNLVWLLLQSNQLDSCPSFTNIPNIQVLSTNNNNLTFDDILPNIGKASNQFNYQPQDSVGTIQTIVLNTNDSYSINLGFDDTVTTSTYNWYKDGIFIGATTTNKFVLNNITTLDAGIYTCEVTNSIATGLTLHTRPITIVVCDAINIGNDTTICQGASISLDANHSGTYLWNTGETTQTITVAPITNTTYTVQVTDGACMMYDTININVNALPTAAFSFTETSDISNDGILNLGDTVHLDGGSSTSVNGGLTYSWNFGDGTNGSLPNILHTYANPGFYNLCLTVTDGCGSDTTCQAITINSTITKPTITQLTNDTLQFDYPALIDATTVNTNTLRIWGEETGLRTGNYHTNGTQVSFVPSIPFRAGELLEITSTSQVQDINGNTVSSFVWRENAPVTNPTEAYFDTLYTGIQLATSYAQYSTSISTADFDKNGMLDIVVRNYSAYGNPTRLVVILQNTDGSYQTPQYYTINASHSSLVGTPDVNNDGYPDIVIRHNVPSQVHVWLNNGNGTFVTTPTIYAQSPYSSGGVWGDIDKDGDLDILATTGIANLSQNKICVYKNTGNGLYQPEITYALPNGLGGNIMVNDLDNDGDLDVTARTTKAFGGTPTLLIYENVNGVLSQFLNEADPNENNINTISDLDGDGNKDLVFNIGVRLGNGDLTINPISTIINGEKRFWANDLNGDNISDLFVYRIYHNGSNWIGNNHEIYLNDGTANFSIDTGITDIYSGSLKLGDMNNDGDLDYVNMRSDGKIYILDNKDKPCLHDDIAFLSFPNDTIVYTDLDSCTAIVSWTPPAVDASCGLLSETTTDTIGDTFVKGETNVTYTFIDSFNNVVNKSFSITVLDKQSPTPQLFPTDTIVYATADTCGTIVNWASPIVVDNCGTVTTENQSHLQGAFFTIGTTMINYLFMDADSNTTSMDFEITVLDTVKPVFTNCPPDTIKSCENIVSWIAPSVTDNCGLQAVTNTHQPNDFFPQGATNVLYIAEDIYGNKDTCKFVVLVHPPVQVSMSATPTLCYESSDGTATVIPNNGTTPFNYQWNTFPIQATATAINLSAAQYIVTVTDVNGCFMVDSISVTEPTVISSTTTLMSDVSCYNGNDGVATVSTTGGVGSFTYLWDNSQTTIQATNLNAGWHHVTITDGNSCTKKDSVFINQPNPLFLNFQTTNVSCYNQSDGQIIATAVGGSSGYSYLWTTNSTNNTITGLSNGFYIVTTTDANNCSRIDTAYISQPAQLQAQPIINQQIGCAGQYGIATAQISGGTLPYNYIWDNGETTAQADSLTAGAHFVSVTDDNGCVVGASLLITAQPILQTSIVLNKPVSCNGGNDAMATVIPIGGTLPYTYIWDNGEITAQAISLNAGMHYVTITDSSSCMVIDSIYVNQPLALNALISTISDTCQQGVGTVVINTSGGVGEYTYLIGGNTYQSPLIQNLLGGTYSYSVLDSNNCVFTNTLSIPNICDSCVLFSPLDFVMNEAYSYTCLGNGQADVNILVKGGKPDFDGSSYVFEQFINGNKTIINDKDGVLNFTVNDGDTWKAIVYDQLYCDSLITEDIFDENKLSCPNYCQLYPLILDATPDTTILPNTPALLQVKNPNISTISWKPKHLVACDDCTSTLATPHERTSFTIRAVDTEGCVGKDTITIKIQSHNATPTIKEWSVLPKGFPLPIGNLNLYPDNALTVFNIWGEMVYYASPYLENWIGQDENGEYLPEGTYLILFETHSKNYANNHKVLGWIILH